MSLEKLSEALINGEVEQAEKAAQEALDAGTSPQKILDEGVLAGMSVVSERFKNLEMYIPEVLKCAKVMHGVMNILEPVLTAEKESSSAGTIVLGTVKGDLHDIGKKLVAMMLEGAGFKVVDIGINQPPENFVEAIKNEQPHIVGMSALLTTTAPEIGNTIEAIKEAGLRENVKIIAGGAVIDQNFIDEVGADAYGPSAVAAVDACQKLVDDLQRT